MNESINKADEYKKKCSFFLYAEILCLGKQQQKKRKIRHIMTKTLK